MIAELLIRAHALVLAVTGKKGLLTIPADPVAEADAQWLAARDAYFRTKPTDKRGRGEARRRVAQSLNNALRTCLKAKQAARSA